MEESLQNDNNEKQSRHFYSPEEDGIIIDKYMEALRQGMDMEAFYMKMADDFEVTVSSIKQRVARLRKAHGIKAKKSKLGNRSLNPSLFDTQIDSSTLLKELSGMVSSFEAIARERDMWKEKYEELHSKIWNLISNS